MIRAIVWKEWREQRAIAAAVMAFAIGALALTAQFVEPTTGGSVWGQSGARELMAQALAYLAGTVCGAMLLADEKEIGTLEFLDTLPARRRALWSGKVVFGLGLTVLQGAILAGLAVAFGCVDQRIPRETYAVVVVLVGLLAFAWGMFGGALARSTLGAVFQGSVASVVVGLGLAVVFVLLFGPRAFGRVAGTATLWFYLTWLGSGLLASALVFTTVDRERRAPPASAVPLAGPGPVRPRRRRPLAGLRALLWLSARQAMYVALATLGAAGVGAAILLAPDAQPVFLWPALTLAFGVLAGITTLGEEQTRGVARFWAERRLPLGRLWLTKVGFHLALALAAGLVLGGPLVLAHSANPFRTRLFAPSNLGAELWRFLLLGLVYGFAVGHLAGMVFRKATVAGLVASVAAATLLGLIYPSVISGGAAAWQVWGPAVVLMLTARWLLYPWATERVTARGPVLRAVGGTAATFAVVGAGLAWRVFEIPNAPDRLAESGFLGTLPSFEEDENGRTARAAVSQFRRAADAAQGDTPRPQATAGGPGANGLTPIFEDPILAALRAGWKAQPQILGPWLDRVFADEGWLGELDKLADAPTAVLENPSNRDVFTPPDAFRNLYEMGLAVRARGLQRLDADRPQPELYPRLLRGGLAAVRSGRNKAGRLAPPPGPPGVSAAMETELVLLTGLEEWLDRVRDRPDLLRPLLADLLRHEREMPVGGDDIRWADQVILRNTMDRVGTWLAPRVLSAAGPRAAAPDPRADSEAEVVTFAWSVPWERARRERILRVETDPRAPPVERWLSELHLRRRWHDVRAEPDAERDQRGLCHRRLAILEVALRLYQHDRGEAAPNLAALVPAYLPAVPTDPYTGAPFGYRQSAGEETLESLAGPVWETPGQLWRMSFGLVASGMSLVVVTDDRRPDGQLIAVGLGRPVYNPPSPRSQPVRVKKGDAVLWSAGPDRRDNGGQHPLSPGGSLIGEDWIVVIPLVLRAGDE